VQLKPATENIGEKGENCG